MSTNTEIIFSSDILKIITSHMYDEDVTKLSILSKTNKYINNIIKNNIIYIQEKNKYIDYCNCVNVIKNIEISEITKKYINIEELLSQFKKELY
jgi:flavorubredoxin